MVGKNSRKKKVKKNSSKKIKSIGILCSGGDSPGMNCAIRAIVRSGIHSGLKIFGIKRGYKGLLDGDIAEMNVSSVGNILQRGGTILQTSRCSEFLKTSYRKKAFNNLQKENIDGLIAIGGDGSFQGLIKLYQEHGLPVVGVPGTIDNDIKGTEYTIGFNTAVNTAIEAVDKIRDTASSHDRIFIIEVMGRNSSAIAVQVGICTGAENVILPDRPMNILEVTKDIQRGIRRGKTSSIIVVAEGKVPGLSYKIQKELMKKSRIPSHVCILGHIQRGGDPTALDRFIASQMGNLAVNCLLENQFPMATSFRDGKVLSVPLKECIGKNDHFNKNFMKLVKVLSI